MNYSVRFVNTENEARDQIREYLKNKEWPCFEFKTDTTGEKLNEKFVAENEIVKKTSFIDINCIQMDEADSSLKIDKIVNSYRLLEKDSNLDLFKIKNFILNIVKNFEHKDSSKNLEQKM